MNPQTVPLAIFGRSYPKAMRMRKNPMMKSQTMPIHAAFHDNAIATVAVAIGPIMKPEIQSRSMVTKNLTPAS